MLIFLYFFWQLIYISNRWEMFALLILIAHMALHQKDKKELDSVCNWARRGVQGHAASGFFKSSHCHMFCCHGNICDHASNVAVQLSASWLTCAYVGTNVLFLFNTTWPYWHNCIESKLWKNKVSTERKKNWHTTSSSN